MQSCECDFKDKCANYAPDVDGKCVDGLSDSIKVTVIRQAAPYSVSATIIMRTPLDQFEVETVKPSCFADKVKENFGKLDELPRDCAELQPDNYMLFVIDGKKVLMPQFNLKNVAQAEEAVKHKR